MNDQPSGNSRSVTSNQHDVHEDVIDLLTRYQQTPYKRPIAHHTQHAFESIEKRVAQMGRPIVLDSGCGVGMSSERLADMHPGHTVIGVDQSLHRLEKNPHFENTGKDNLLLVQADCVDFWRLALMAEWNIEKHTILYPNPWPKKSHLKRRWQGHPVFLSLPALCDTIELRTNWEIYAKEFALAWQHITGEETHLTPFVPDTYFTHFEKKYHESGQILYRLNCGGKMR